MAKSRFEYVKKFEMNDELLPGTWLVVRVDGKGFTKFCEAHSFIKPNDDRGLHLMNKCAQTIMSEFGDVELAYGESDEYSFMLPPSSSLYRRRASKLQSSFASLFSSSFVFYWPQFFPTLPLQSPPSFDARVVAYPSPKNIRDYFAWRQADCHINNMYNVCFWALVQKGGMSNVEAEATLRSTVSSEKQELLFSRFGINYNTLPPMHRRGSVLVRRAVAEQQEQEEEKTTGGGGGADATTARGVRDLTLTPSVTLPPPPTAAADAADASSTGEGGGGGRGGEGRKRRASTSPTQPGGAGRADAGGGGEGDKPKQKRTKKSKPRRQVVVVHDDIIKQPFWTAHPHLLLQP